MTQISPKANAEVGKARNYCWLTAKKNSETNFELSSHNQDKENETREC